MGSTGNVPIGAARNGSEPRSALPAEEGANLILIDICEPIPVLELSLSTSEDLNETARLAEKHGVRVVTHVVDVRDDALAAAVNDGVAELVAWTHQWPTPAC